MMSAAPHLFVVEGVGDTTDDAHPGDESTGRPFNVACWRETATIAVFIVVGGLDTSGRNEHNLVVERGHNRFEFFIVILCWSLWYFPTSTSLPN